MDSRKRLQQKRRRTRKLTAYFYFRNELITYQKRLQEAFYTYKEVMDGRARKHADFFEAPKKEIKELSVTHSFFQLLEPKIGDHLKSAHIAEDPPDIKVVTHKGKKIGVEVTELVNEKAIRYQIQGKRMEYLKAILSWNENSFNQALQGIITEKAGKCIKVPEGYDSLYLLIFTDEPRLDSDKMKMYLEGYHFSDLERFSGVFILTSYEPKYKGKVLLQI